MDPLHLGIALGPLAAYLLLLGAINLSKRPFLTTGARDTSALGVAISGFVVAGPMELFLPLAAAERFGGYIWVLLLALYVLCLTLLVLLMRPRLVIYNISCEQLRPLLADVVGPLDKEARWAGEGLVLPNLGVHLHAEPAPNMRNVQLVATGPRQNYAGWRKLEAALGEALRDVNTRPNPYGGSLVLFGGVLLSVTLYWMLSDQQAVAQALDQMLRRR